MSSKKDPRTELGDRLPALPSGWCWVISVNEDDDGRMSVYASARDETGATVFEQKAAHLTIGSIIGAAHAGRTAYREGGKKKDLMRSLAGVYLEVPEEESK